MANTLTARRLTASEPVRTVACGNCNAQVQHIQAVPISPTCTQRVCDECAPIVRYTAPDAPSGVSLLDAAQLDTLLQETAPADEDYCISCYQPYSATRPHQHRCADCAEKIAAQWAAVPPQPKPPKLVLVQQPEKLAPMVLCRAMWLQVWANWQQANNPAMLIRRLDAHIKPGPQIVRAATAPSWESWSENEFRQKMVVPKVPEAVAA